MTKKTYSGGSPPVTDAPALFTYDVAAIDGLSIQKPVGRLVKVAQGSTRTVSSYDSMGRIKDQWQCTPLNCGTGWYQLTYNYNLASGVTNYTDGAGHTFTQTFNAAARLTGLTSSLIDAQHPGTLASAFSYFASGAIQQVTYGNNLVHRVDMNKRLQPCRMRTRNATMSAVPCTDPDPAGDFLQLKYSYGALNNGNIASWSATGQQSFSRTFTYDELNRVKTMTDAQCNYTWTYDIWANRTAQDATGGTGPCGEHFPTITTANRITGLGYDLAGNVTSDGSTTYQWDAESRMKSINGGGTNPEYTYDANGRRVRKKASGVTTEYVYGLSGSVVAEFQGPTWTKCYVYMGGLLAQYSNSTTYFAHKDHLGSTRLLSNVSGGNHEPHDYFPFGESPNPQGTGTTHQFTGKERDPESGLDNFGARYFGSSSGRFVSPDPLLNSGRPWQPQSWNRYAYTLNNPVNLIDPLGLFEWKSNCAQNDSKCLKEEDKAKKRVLDALARIKKDLESKRLSADEKKILRGILDTYGTENQKNGVFIQFGDLRGAYARSTNEGNGVLNVTINFGSFDRDVREAGADKGLETAAMVAHEGDHLVMQSIYGGPTSYQELKHYEMGGYNAQSMINVAENKSSMYGLWNPSWGKADREVNRMREIERYGEVAMKRVVAAEATKNLWVPF